MTWIYFNYDEFACPCCGDNETKPDFIDKLNQLRGLCKFPLVINSGYRCVLHNEAIEGSRKSSHLRGLAADVKIMDSKQRYTIVNYAIICGINRIGISENFIHLDCDPNKKKNVIWIYK